MKRELTPVEKARKTAEYEALKNASIAYVQSLPENEQDVIFKVASRIQAMTLKNAQYYDTGTFYHFMDAGKSIYYARTKGTMSEVAHEADVKVENAVLSVQPTVDGPSIVNENKARVRRAKASPATEQAQAVAQVMSQDATAQILSAIQNLAAKVAKQQVDIDALADLQASPIPAHVEQM